MSRLREISGQEKQVKKLDEQCNELIASLNEYKIAKQEFDENIQKIFRLRDGFKVINELFEQLDLYSLDPNADPPSPDSSVSENDDQKINHIKNKNPSESPLIKHTFLNKHKIYSDTEHERKKLINLIMLIKKNSILMQKINESPFGDDRWISLKIAALQVKYEDIMPNIPFNESLKEFKKK